MKLNKSKFIYILKNLEYPSVSKKRNWDTMYNNKTSTFWNNLLWNAILEESNITGKSIDRYEFYTFCDYYCNNHNANIIFNSINNKSRCIHLNEFEEYLEKLDDKDYINILKCLNLYNTNIQSQPKTEQKPEAEPKPETEVESEIIIEPEPEPEPETETETEPEPEPEPETEPEPELEPESESEIIIEPEVESEIIIEPEPEREVETKVESEIIIEPEPKREVEIEPELEPEPELDLLPQPKVEVRENNTFLKKWCNYNNFINNIKKYFFKAFY
jgi:hypothetical protein